MPWKSTENTSLNGELNIYSSDPNDFRIIESCVQQWSNIFRCCPFRPFYGPYFSFSSRAYTLKVYIMYNLTFMTAIHVLALCWTLTFGFLLFLIFCTICAEWYLRATFGDVDGAHPNAQVLMRVRKMMSETANWYTPLDLIAVTYSYLDILWSNVQAMKSSQCIIIFWIASNICTLMECRKWSQPTIRPSHRDTECEMLNWLVVNLSKFSMEFAIIRWKFFPIFRSLSSFFSKH